MRVVCAGHVNWDVTLFVDRVPTPAAETRVCEQHQSVGGSAANVAVGLAGLDVPTGLVGSVGDDEYGMLARWTLDDAGVDLGGLRTVDDDTAVKYLLVPPDGAVLVLGADGANEAIGPGDVDAAYVREADHLHLTGQRPETAARLAEIAVDAGMSVSFDPGRRVGDRDYGAVYPSIDLLFVNEHEVDAVADRPAGAVVTKYGSDGARAETPDGSHEHPGYDVEQVDEAGAGDAFAAGFLATWLDGGDVTSALATANACGALAAASEGAQSRLAWSAVRELRNG